MGIAGSVVVHLYRSMDEVRVKELVEGDPLPVERDAPRRLASGSVTVLLPYGHLFFAGARQLEDRLPLADGARRAVVVLLLRGHRDLGSTFLGAVHRYGSALRTGGGRLVLVGVSDRFRRQLERTGVLAELGSENVFPATARYGEAALAAKAACDAWLAARDP